MARKPVTTCNGRHFSHSTPPLFIKLFPSDIRYIHITSSPLLSSGLHVVDLLRRCLLQDITIEDLTNKNLDIFTVMKFGGEHWTTDGNKRLWVLKELESMGLCGKITVRVLRRRDYSRWSRLASTASAGRNIQFCFTDMDKLGFEQKVKDVLKEFENIEHRLFAPRPASTRFLWAPHPSPAEIMTRWVENEFRNSGNYQWFRGPYNVERPVILGFIFLFFVISLSVISKKIPVAE